MGNLSNQNTFNQCFMVVLKLRSAIYLKIYWEVHIFFLYRWPWSILESCFPYFI